MNRKLPWLLTVLFLASFHSAEAQQPGKVYRLGYLSNTDAAGESTRSEAIRLALRKLGYIEGQNIATEYRYTQRKVDRAPELANELVRLKVDIILVAGGTIYVRPAMNATKTIPIIMVGGGRDPVEAGVVESLARPGGNVTGMTLLARELGGKRLELLKEAVPKLARSLFSTIRPFRALHASERRPPGRGACAGVDRSALGGTRCGRFRESSWCAEQGAPEWTLCARRRPGNSC
jgi:putative ABC transport system substrate-binding protein